MNKKPYRRPLVKRVRLVVKNAVLAVCHSSPNLTPRDIPEPGDGCLVNNCYTP